MGHAPARRPPPRPGQPQGDPMGPEAIPDHLQVSVFGSMLATVGLICGWGWPGAVMGTVLLAATCGRTLLWIRRDQARVDLVMARRAIVLAEEAEDLLPTSYTRAEVGLPPVVPPPDPRCRPTGTIVLPANVARPLDITKHVGGLPPAGPRVLDDVCEHVPRCVTYAEHRLRA